MRPPLEGSAVCGLGVVSFFLLPLPAPTHPTQFHPPGLPDSRSALGTGDLCPSVRAQGLRSGEGHQGLGCSKDEGGGPSHCWLHLFNQRGSLSSCQVGFFFFFSWCVLSKQEATESIFVFPEGGVCVVFSFFPFPPSLVLCNPKSLLSCLWLRGGWRSWWCRWPCGSSCPWGAYKGLKDAVI